jgi:hypothetical protein
VWIDRGELRVGDSLRERIDAGLANSRYGIVILSPHFFGKHYPTRELNGLAQRESGGAKVILPVWKDVSDIDVRRFSPPLADRIAARWETGLEAVASKLLLEIRPDIVEQVKEKASRVIELPLVNSGEQLMSALRGSHAHQYVHDSFNSEEEAERIGSFLQELTDWIDISDDLEVAENIRAEFRIAEEVRALEAEGWKVFAAQLRRRIRLGEEETTWLIAAVAVVRSDREGVAVMDDQFVVRKRRSASAS